MTLRPINASSMNQDPGKFTRLDIRLRGALCYIDACTEPEAPSRRLFHALDKTRQEYLDWVREVPLHLCGLRYFDDETAWSMAFIGEAAVQELWVEAD